MIRSLQFNRGTKLLFKFDGGDVPVIEKINEYLSHNVYCSDIDALLNFVPLIPCEYIQLLIEIMLKKYPGASSQTDIGKGIKWAIQHYQKQYEEIFKEWLPLIILPGVFADGGFNIIDIGNISTYELLMRRAMREVKPDQSLYASQVTAEHYSKDLFSYYKGGFVTSNREARQFGIRFEVGERYFYDSHVITYKLPFFFLDKKTNTIYRFVPDKSGIGAAVTSIGTII